MISIKLTHISYFISAFLKGISPSLCTNSLLCSLPFSAVGENFTFFPDVALMLGLFLCFFMHFDLIIGLEFFFLQLEWMRGCTFLTLIVENLMFRHFSWIFMSNSCYFYLFFLPLFPFWRIKTDLFWELFYLHHSFDLYQYFCFLFQDLIQIISYFWYFASYLPQ